MTIRRDYILYIWLIVTEEHPRKESGYRWGLIGKHYSAYSENVFSDKCSCVTSAMNFAVNHKYGIKATYFTERAAFEITR